MRQREERESIKRHRERERYLLIRKRSGDVF